MYTRWISLGGYWEQILWWKEKEDCLPTVVPALLIQHRKFCGWLVFFFFPSSKFSHHDWHCNFCFPCQAQQRQHFLCVPSCASVESQPIKRTWLNPVVCVVEGIMECSHDNFYCQGSNLWQGKKDSISNRCKLFPKESGAQSLPSSWICISTSFLTHRTAEEFRGSLKISLDNEMCQHSSACP